MFAPVVKESVTMNNKPETAAAKPTGRRMSLGAQIPREGLVPPPPRLAMTREQLVRADGHFYRISDVIEVLPAEPQPEEDAIEFSNGIRTASEVEAACREIADKKMPCPSLELPAEIAEIPNEGPEVDVEEVKRIYNETRNRSSMATWSGVVLGGQSAMVKFAQHFQNRGFQLGRELENRLKDEAISRMTDDICAWAESDGKKGKQIESLQQQLKAVTEERDRLRREKFEHLIRLGSAMGIPTPEKQSDMISGDLEEVIGKATKKLKPKSQTKEGCFPKSKIGEMAIHILECPDCLGEFQQYTDTANPRIQAIAGPPTREALEAAGDRDCVFVKWHADQARWDYYEAKYIRHLESSGKLHIAFHAIFDTSQIITPPAPSPEQEGMPGCPWWHCDGELYLFKLDGDGGCCWKCGKCARESSRFESEQSAISAALSAGKGEL